MVLVSESKAIHDCVISTRIRLARNIAGYPFRFKLKNEQSAKSITKLVYDAASKIERFEAVFMKNIGEEEADSLIERHLISVDLLDNKSLGAVLVNRDESVSIMLHEEDHVREQCIIKGYKLDEAYMRISQIDDKLSESVDFAFDKELGYLTACPTNLGTGMRASVMLFLPALTEINKIPDVIYNVSKLGLTVRGVYGEGSTAEGYMYQISNEVTLGKDEGDILSVVKDAVVKLCLAETQAREKCFENSPDNMTDRCMRAYGTLTNSYILPLNEFMELIPQVKLGASLDVLNFSDDSLIDDLIVSVRPASLSIYGGGNITPAKRDILRAEYVADALKKITITRK